MTETPIPLELETGVTSSSQGTGETGVEAGVRPVTVRFSIEGADKESLVK